MEQMFADWGWTGDFSYLALVGQVGVAMLLGGAIGVERELAGKPAGFRTMMLVAGSSTLLVQLSEILVNSFEQTMRVEADPVRVIQAIVIGISFLGAGTIFRDSDAGVEGLTTAATILTASAIGITVALGELALAISVTALVLLVLTLLGAVERALARRRGRRTRRSSTAGRRDSGETNERT